MKNLGSSIGVRKRIVETKMKIKHSKNRQATQKLTPTRPASELEHRRKVTSI
jgi:hypothetical protein